MNVITGWQEKEYAQMGLWPGDAHYQQRYEYCEEYVTVMKELWATGRSDFKGQFFTMDDCRCSPLPSRPIPIVCAGQSDRGTRFAAEYADFNFVSRQGVNEPTKIAPSVARLVAATADRPDLRCAGADHDHRRRDGRGGRSPSGSTTRPAPTSRRCTTATARPATNAPASKEPTIANFAAATAQKLPSAQNVLVGSYASIAAMLDELAAVPGVQGAMLTFDDFVIGMEQFGTRIQPLMQSRRDLPLAA